jgi:hypothetical protein
MGNPLPPGSPFQNGFPLPTDITHGTLFPWAVAGLPTLTLTSKGMRQSVLEFLQSSAERVYAQIAQNGSKLYRSISTLANQPIDNLIDYCKFSASLANVIRNLGTVVPPQRILCFEEVQSLSQAIESKALDAALEYMWPRVISGIKENHPDLDLDAKMPALEIQTWMRDNAALLLKIQSLDL